MAVISKPVMGALSVLVLAAGIFYFQSDPVPAPVVKAKLHPKAPVETDEVPDFMPEDFSKRFERAKPISRNIFVAPGNSAHPLGLVANGLLDKVPSELADGDGNWIFTGVAILDGKKMALLENGTSHQGAYVTEGTVWKSSRIKRISSEGVAFSPKVGEQELVVYRFRAPVVVASATPPPSPALPPAQPVQPMNPGPMSGPIGDGMIIRRSGRRFKGGIVFQAGTP